MFKYGFKMLDSLCKTTIKMCWHKLYVAGENQKLEKTEIIDVHQALHWGQFTSFKVFWDFLTTQGSLNESVSSGSRMRVSPRAIEWECLFRLTNENVSSGSLNESVSWGSQRRKSPRAVEWECLFFSPMVLVKIKLIVLTSKPVSICIWLQVGFP